jgi:TetR/AcrR family transcriptional repressor of nem operon
MKNMGRPARSADAGAETSTRILDVAERLVQTQGFNGFSYADIADELGIRKASLHYHFPTKAALGRRLIERYGESFGAALAGIRAASGEAPRMLERYVDLYREVLSGDRMCLCGMLAAEYATLPKGMQSEIRRFFDLNEEWLGEILERGRKDGKLSFVGPARDTARTLVGALEGAMLLARSYGDASRFATAARHLLADLGMSSRAPSASPTRITRARTQTVG